MKGLYPKYFVLKPEGDSMYAYASRRAMQLYADIIRTSNSILAEELDQWVAKEYSFDDEGREEYNPGQGSD
jgi:hypothetical protein